MVRETDHHLLRLQVLKIGVASTKAFTTQLAALMLLILKLVKLNNVLMPIEGKLQSFMALPRSNFRYFTSNTEILRLSALFVEKTTACSWDVAHTSLSLRRRIETERNFIHSC